VLADTALTACSTAGPGAGTPAGTSGGGGGLVFLSDQLSQTTESQAMRTQVLSGFSGGSVDFISFSDTTKFITQVVAQAKAGAAKVDVIGGLQGDFVSLQAQVPLRDMTDVISQLADRQFPQAYLDLAKIDGAYRFVPWITATYLMVASKQALRYLPAGANVNALTYAQLLAWGQALKKATGRPLLGFPASPDGLIKRFIQGYLYPSFTGGLNTTFDSPGAVTAWQWFKQAWAVSNPQSPTYAFMQEPLQSGEVWVAWDHAVRLINALKSAPDQFVAFPAPTGPRGRGYLPVLGGLAIPSTSKNVTKATQLISYLTEPKTTATMLNAEAWFPPTGPGHLPPGLAPGISDEATAIQATVSSPATISSQLPIGLGSHSSTYDKVFVDTFTAIAISNAPIPATLSSQATTLQGILQAANAACWKPDPPASGVCKVG
jgi:multiple sugar transport system substrate-binding protein